MRRLVVFIALAAALLAGVAVFDWWVDPVGEVYKPAALAEARAGGCLVSQELVGNEYYAFKTDVFRSRPTRTFVVGSSRVLKIAARPGESSFSNLGYPGTAPETILKLFRHLPARPVQTVYVGVESFWFNATYTVPDTDTSAYHLAEYLVSRSTFQQAVHFVRQAHYILTHRWRRENVGDRCVIGRIFPSIAWDTDGSRVWSFELDPKRFARIVGAPYLGDLLTWRNGYYANWKAFDTKRLRILGQALALARARGWKVVGFAPPEPPALLHVLETDPRIAPFWRQFLQVVPALFRRYGDAWASVENGARLGCRPVDFPDHFHTDAACSARVRAKLDAAAAHGS